MGFTVCVCISSLLPFSILSTVYFYSVYCLLFVYCPSLVILSFLSHFQFVSPFSFHFSLHWPFLSLPHHKFPSFSLCVSVSSLLPLYSVYCELFMYRLLSISLVILSFCLTLHVSSNFSLYRPFLSLFPTTKFPLLHSITS